MSATMLMDASVWLAALDADDRHHDAAQGLVADSEPGSLAALDLTLYEIANVAAVRWRSTAAAARLVDLVQDACGDAVVRIDRRLAAAAAALAAEHRLTVYDAAYVAAAGSNDWTLVSTDMTDLVRPGHAKAPDEALADL